MNKMKTNRQSGLWRALVVLCLVGFLVTIFTSTRASAQEADQGAIIGVVTDSTGAIIPSADVTLPNLDTGLVLKTKSNGSGNYFFGPIKIGNYSVGASSTGFQTTVDT